MQVISRGKQCLLHSLLSPDVFNKEQFHKKMKHDWYVELLLYLWPFFASPYWARAYYVFKCKSFVTCANIVHLSRSAGNHHFFRLCKSSVCEKQNMVAHYALLITYSNAERWFTDLLENGVSGKSWLHVKRTRARSFAVRKTQFLCGWQILIWATQPRTQKIVNCIT